MSFRTNLILLIAVGLATPVAGWAKPPAHAPAHGYRAKHKPEKQHVEHSDGFRVVLDSERGIHVVVGLPGVYFHAGHYYRRVEGHWQVSSRANSGWNAAKHDAIPHAVHRAHGHSGPAKARHKK